MDINFETINDIPELKLNEAFLLTTPEKAYVCRTLFAVRKIMADRYPAWNADCFRRGQKTIGFDKTIPHSNIRLQVIPFYSTTNKTADDGATND